MMTDTRCGVMVYADTRGVQHRCMILSYVLIGQRTLALRLTTGEKREVQVRRWQFRAVKVVRQQPSRLVPYDALDPSAQRAFLEAQATND